MCNTSEVRCAHGGECEEGLGASFTCRCPPGWGGETCRENVDECQSSPCLNDGHCQDRDGDFFCSCPFSFAGRLCEERLERCEDSPCMNGAVCLVDIFNILI